MHPNSPFKHILLIDDDADFGQLLTDVFEGSNYVLTVFKDPHEGLRFALTSTQLDLILLDIDMPELNGLEILRQLKRTHAGKTPVIMLTACSDLQSVQEAVGIGAEGYLLKPFRLHHFKSALKRLFKDDITMPIPVAAAKTTAELSLETPKTHHILLIDDQVNMHFLMRETLEKSICDIISCFNGKDAIEQIKYHQPDLILLDLYLPDMDGLEVLQEIRRTFPDLRVLILVSDSKNEKLEQARQFNIQGYVLRDFNYYSVISQLEKEIETPLFPAGI